LLESAVKSSDNALKEGKVCRHLISDVLFIVDLFLFRGIRCVWLDEPRAIQWNDSHCHYIGSEKRKDN
jgi:hypothetical protein